MVPIFGVAGFLAACSDGEVRLPSTVEGFKLPEDGIVLVKSESTGAPGTGVAVYTDDDVPSLRSMFAIAAGRAGEIDWTYCPDATTNDADEWSFRSFDGDRELTISVGSSGASSTTRSFISFKTVFDGAGPDCPGSD
ncbi:MAG: hypothetical protein ACT452_03715 [Microthrixaceae bacterium]